MKIISVINNNNTFTNSLGQKQTNMKTSIIYTLVLIFSLTIMSSTTSSKKQRTYKGYVITLQQDTIYGTLKVSSPTINELKIKFYDEANRKTVYTPNDLEGYSFEVPRYDRDGKKSMLWIQFKKRTAEKSPIKMGSKEIFAEVRVDGNITLYDYYIEKNAKIGQMVEHQYYIEKEGEAKFQYISRDNYKSILKRLTADNSDLNKKIGTSGYGYKYLPKMIERYNSEKRTIPTQQTPVLDEPLLTKAD